MGARFLIVCGGTGGHLAPGIAVAEELETGGDECSLLISNKQVDSRLVRAYPHLRFTRLPGAAFGRSPVRLARFGMEFVQGLRTGARLVRTEVPAAVLAFGGFLSLGVVLAASRRGIPVALHEANHYPGRSVRFLRRFASRIYLPSGVELPGVDRERVRRLGYPVRRQFQPLSRAEARRALGLPEEGFLLAVFGGSQGAAALNDWADQYRAALFEQGIDLYCVRGMGKGSEGVLAESNGAGERRMVNVAFSDAMHLVLPAADLAVSRAGAGAIAEMARCGLPSVLVPFPFAADDHQTANARHLESRGGCVVCEQESLGSMLETVFSLRNDPARLRSMADHLSAVARENETAPLVADLRVLASR